MGKPETPQILRERAVECERQAAEATLPEVRKTLLNVAARWRALADEGEEVLASRRRARARYRLSP
jgi:ribosomal protein L34